jgi:hypothetical protein
LRAKYDHQPGNRVAYLQQNRPAGPKKRGATTDDSENGRGCNTFELSVARIHSNTSGSKDLMHAGG